MAHPLIFATHNPNKLKEIKPLMPEGYPLLSLKDFDFQEDIPETMKTIEGNAKQKAQTVHQKLNHDCFADDTGLEVPALNGEPGVYSARYAGANAKDADNINLLLQNMKEASDRKAWFKTIICLILDGQQYTFEGITKGTILKKRQGSAGFGYDPIFQPEGYDRTYAEMSMEEKNRISHRGKALRAMADFLRK